MKTHLSHFGLAVVLVATCAVAIDAPALELRFRAADTTSSDSTSVTTRSRSTGCTSSTSTRTTGTCPSTPTHTRERASYPHSYPDATGHVPVYHHEVSRIEVKTAPGQPYVAWPGGVVLPGTSGHCPTVGVRWIPGHWEYRERRVWVPDRWETKRHPPVYEQRLINHRIVPVMVRAAWYEKVLIPGHYEVVTDRVWVPGYYAYY